MFTAGRSMGAVPVGLSTMVTAFSSLNMMAFPSEVFEHGLYVTIALPVFFLVGIPLTRYVIPAIVRAGRVSIYDMFIDRFGLSVMRLASLIFLLWRMIWMSVLLYACGRLLAVTVGMNIYLGIVIAGTVAVVYTTIGGMRAVMTTDILQCGVMVFALALFVHLGIAYHTLGIAGVYADIVSQGALKPFVPFDPEFLSFDPTVRITFWSGLTGVFVAFMARYGADQVVTQRYISAKSVAVARKGYWLNATVAVAAIVCLGAAGLVAKSYALQSGLLSSGLPPLKIIAIMASRMPAGVGGLLAAALLAATMSSMDSGINAVTAVWFTSLRPVGPKSGTAPMQTFTMGCGAAVIGLSLLLVNLLGAQQSIFRLINQVVNGMGTPLLALFVVSKTGKRVNGRGVFWGGITGTVLSGVTVMCIKNLALHYYAVVNFLITLGLCLLFSRVFRSL